LLAVWALLAVAFFTGGAGCHERARSEVQSLTLSTSDGVRLAAQCFIPVQDHPPGLLLVHRLGGARQDWEVLARSVQQSGYMALSFDLRGHGESCQQVDGLLDYRNFDDGQWRDAQLDIAAAKAAVLANGADPKNLFIAGEALGASLAMAYAASDPDIQGVVLLSPGLDYKGIDSVALMPSFATRPMLLIWSEGDAYAVSAAGTLQRAVVGHVEVHSYPGSAHGTDILTLLPHSVGQISVWLGQMLETERASS